MISMKQLNVKQFKDDAERNVLVITDHNNIAKITKSNYSFASEYTLLKTSSEITVFCDLKHVRAMISTTLRHTIVYKLWSTSSNKLFKENKQIFDLSLFTGAENLLIEP